MSNKNLLDNKIDSFKNISQNVITFPKINIFHSLINRSIEIVTVPKLKDINANQANVGIVLDEKLIFKILSENYKKVLITEIKTKKDLDKLALRKPDLVFSGVKYFNFNKKKIWLNDYLELNDILYIASNKSSLLKESNKSRAKKIIQKSNISTADFFTTEPEEHESEKSLPIMFPLFVKPITGGDSRGIDRNSIVHNYLSYKKKVLEIKKNQNSRCLVEKYLSGKEYSVGIFKDNMTGSFEVMPIEIVVKKNINGNHILDFDIKKNDEEKVIAVLNVKIFDQLSILAKKSFIALKGKSFGRIDFKMDNLGNLYFIEANLMPGLRKGYFYRSCLLNLNINYEEMILKITANGLH
jgi:D-alanine-D-alanine ligase